MSTMDPALTLEVAALSRHTVLRAALARGDSSIQQYYQDRVALVTGGSGFMGKQLVEKMFRACEIKKLFLLLRGKNGKNINERLAEVLKDPVFDELHVTHPDFPKRIVPIAADIQEIELAISSEDRTMIAEEVEVIFHLAATTRFDETLATAAIINVRGTQELIQLAKECKKLKSFVHVSTAYTFATKDRIDREVKEEFYPPPIAPNAVLALIDTLDAEKLEKITPILTKNWPNTYTFTKAIAEELVRSALGELPICIVRPAVVTPTYREPSPGWCDIGTAFGASGVLLAPGLGLMHAVFANFETRISIVPADYVNNAILVAGERGERGKIYTVSTSSRNPIVWRNLARMTLSVGKSLPTPKAVWYICLVHVNSFRQFWIISWLLHFIPAYLIDGACALVGKERRLVNLYTKIYKIFSVLSYFTTNNWDMKDGHAEKLYQSLSTTDREIFNFNIKDIDWSEYSTIWCLGLRKYIVKDGLKNTEYALKKQRWLRVANYAAVSIYFYALWLVLSFLFSSISKLVFGF